MDCVDTKGTHRPAISAARSAGRHTAPLRRLSLREIFRLVRSAIASTWEIPGFGGLSRIAAMRQRVTRSEEGDGHDPAPPGGVGGAPALTAKPDRDREPQEAADLSAGDFGELLRDAAGIAARYWRRLPTRRAFTRPPDEVVERIRDEPLPRDASPLEEIFDRR